MSRRTTTLLAWLWIAVALAAYLAQFRDLLQPILRLIGGG